MANNKSSAPEPAAKPEEPTPDPTQVNVVWLNPLSPLLIGKYADCKAFAEQNGIAIYYVAINVDVFDSVDDKTKKPNYVRSAGIAKVVNNLIGESITKVSDPLVEFDNVMEYAHFSLPKLPLELVLKLDKFFRRVDEDKGAEAIVLLTYDPTVGGSEGWGVLVPKQRNTAGSCDYEPLSVVDDQPDNAHIVGSVHSHPGMSAFASHTDIGDQADFDGLHITFGWTTPHKTEYYIEMQMGGSRFTLTPEQVFENPPMPEVTDDLSDWMSKVEKAAPAVSGYGYGYAHDYYGYGSSKSYSGGTTTGYNATKKITLPKGCPDIEANVVITNWKNGYERACPVCNTTVSAIARDDRRCNHCMVFIAEQGETAEDIIEARAHPAGGKAPLPTQNLTHPWKPIWFWRREENNGQTLTTLEQLWTPRQTTPPPRWVQAVRTMADPDQEPTTNIFGELEETTPGKVDGQLSLADEIMLAKHVPEYLVDEWDHNEWMAPFAAPRVCLNCGWEADATAVLCANRDCPGSEILHAADLMPVWWTIPHEDRQAQMHATKYFCMLCNRPLDDQEKCDCTNVSDVANSQVDAFGMWDHDPYAVDGLCNYCEHYFEASCPLLRSAVRVFHDVSALTYQPDEIVHTIVGCPGFMPDQRYLGAEDKVSPEAIIHRLNAVDDVELAEVVPLPASGELTIIDGKDNA